VIITGCASSFNEHAPGMDWGLISPPPGWNVSAIFVVWQPNSLRGIAALVGSDRSRPGKRISFSMKCRTTHPTCRRHSSMNVLRSMARA